MTPVRSLKTGLIKGTMLVGNLKFALPFDILVVAGGGGGGGAHGGGGCLLYTSPSPRDRQKSRMPSSA